MLRLTAKGRTELAGATSVMDRIHADLTARLGEPGRAELDALLIKMVQEGGA